MLNKILKLILIILISRFILTLYFNGSLNTLIHPRYSIFTLLSALFTILVSSISLIIFIKHKKEMESEKSNPFSILIHLILVFIVFYIPNITINPLSSATFSKRSIDINTFSNVNYEEDIKTFDLFTNQTEYFTLGDWVKSINLNPDPNKYVGRKVSVDGFVYKDENTLENTFLLSRFVITCCAVDARPVGLNILTSENFESDKWVKVEGVFSINNINSEELLVIEPQTITEIDTPKQPYIIN